MKKVVLAYSGGLDTSVAIHWLKKKGFKVVAFLADLGQESDFKKLVQRAKLAGAGNSYVMNVRKEFVEDYCFRALKADAVYEGKYLLATALSRPLIAEKLVAVALNEKADYIAHGCTGKGNDQVRFEVSAGILAPHLKTIAPLRVWELKSRNEEIEYAQKYRIPVDVTKKSPYSIDRNCLLYTSPSPRD